MHELEIVKPAIPTGLDYKTQETSELMTSPF